MFIMPCLLTPDCCAGGKLVIINLQRTLKDSKAHLVIHERTDHVMQQLAQRLNMPIPDYVRKDSLIVRHELRRPKLCIGDPQRSNSHFFISVESSHGAKCPLPWVTRVEVDFQVCMELLPMLISCHNKTLTTASRVTLLKAKKAVFQGHSTGT